MVNHLERVDAVFNKAEQNNDPQGFWKSIRDAYYGDERMLDFNSGGLGAMTKEAWAAYETELKEYRIKPSIRIGRSYVKFLQETKEMLAPYAGVSADELALLRNATDGLAIAIFGIPLKRGDEVVISKYDYPHVYYAWKQREARDGIVVREADFCPIKDKKSKIRKAYLSAVTPKTKAISITDLINYNGCLVPTKEIIDGLPSHVEWRIVDAAQSFANTMIDLSSFGATHVAVSGHKWFGGPIGTGMLYVRKDAILDTWPLFATHDSTKNDASRFEHVGTRDMASLFGLQSAMAFQESIGQKRKQKRLRQLSNYAFKKLNALEALECRSPKQKSLRTNLLLFSTGAPKDDRKLVSHLYKKHGMRCTRYDQHDASGVRISINVFHNTDDIDFLVEKIAKYLN